MKKASRRTFAINNTIGYVPSKAPHPGVYRSVRIEARAAGQGKLLVRARTGYIAGESGTSRNGGVP